MKHWKQVIIIKIYVFINEYTDGKQYSHHFMTNLWNSIECYVVLYRKKHTAILRYYMLLFNADEAVWWIYRFCETIFY